MLRWQKATGIRRRVLQIGLAPEGVGLAVLHRFHRRGLELRVEADALLGGGGGKVDQLAEQFLIRVGAEGEHLHRGAGHLGEYLGSLGGHRH